MSPLFAELLEDADQEEVIKFSNISKEDFQRILEFCSLCNYDSQQIRPRRLLAKPDATEHAQVVTLTDDWKVKFFAELSLDQVVSLANAANYLNIPLLMDACCEVIALQLRKVVKNTSEKKPDLVQVSKQDDEFLRN